MKHLPKITFITSLVRCLGVTTVILVSWHFVLSILVSFQHERNTQRHLLISEKMHDIAEYQKRQQNMVNSQARLNFIANLRRQNDTAARVLAELGRITPQTIQLTQLKWQEKAMMIAGYTASYSELVGWLDQLRNTSTMSRPVITMVDNKDALKYFQLKSGPGNEQVS